MTYPFCGQHEGGRRAAAGKIMTISTDRNEHPTRRVANKPPGSTQWRNRWDAARMFLSADGEAGKR